ncbi:GntR family transcriptional regulator [Acidiferrimicrobium sp. IK]|nr:GntR family transcriptional regulator [Acidiferrimicrobium sp. IK]
MPLWSQVLDDLRGRLSAGEFAEGFPGDVELTSQYRVSRQTVREALRRLQQEGVIERGRGRGTFVRQRPVEQQMGTLYSLYRSAEEQGFVQESQVRFLEVRRDPEAAAMLGRGPADPLVYLERVRMIDGHPVVLDCSWLPAQLASPLLDADFHRTALYQEMDARCGLRPDAGWERVSPVLPTPEQRALLGMRVRSPAYGIERLACQGNLAVEWRHGVIRADRFRFVARWGGGRVDAAFESPSGGRAAACSQPVPAATAEVESPPQRRGGRRGSAVGG